MARYSLLNTQFQLERKSDPCAAKNHKKPIQDSGATQDCTRLRRDNMTPLRALYLALAICHTAQARLSRSRTRVHHSTIQHATMHNEPDAMGIICACRVRLFAPGPRERVGGRADRAVPGDSSGAGCWGPGVGAAPGAPRLSYVIGSPSRSSSPTSGRRRRAR